MKKRPVKMLVDLVLVQLFKSAILKCMLYTEDILSSFIVHSPMNVLSELTVCADEKSC